MAANGRPLLEHNGADDTDPHRVRTGTHPRQPDTDGIDKPSSGSLDRALVRFSGRARRRSADACSGNPRSRREPLTARAGPPVAG